MAQMEFGMQGLIRENDVEFVKLEIVDTYGCSRGLHINAPFFLNNISTGFHKSQAVLCMTPSGEFVKGTGFFEEGCYTNATFSPDLATFTVLPWLDKTASVLVDLRNECGNDHPCSPRAICKTQIDKLALLGFRLYSAFEYEFYLLDAETKQVVNSDVNFLSTECASKFTPLVNDIMRNMNSIGIEPELFHCEDGPSQLEITFSPSFGIKSPDNAFRFKQLVKETAKKHGYMATFMSKPFKAFSGSSGHFNHSLWDVDGKNIFYDADLKYGLSEIAQHWLAGLIFHSDALQCLASPTSNCVERTNAATYAPNNNGWGIDNRTVANRVKKDDPKNIYLEQRAASSAANPYLLTAACIIAGMDGIKRGLILGDPIEEAVGIQTVLPDHVKALPNSLSASIDCLLDDEVFVEAFGPEFLKLYSTMKRYEHKNAEKHRSEGDLYKCYWKFYGEYI